MNNKTIPGYYVMNPSKEEENYLHKLKFCLTCAYFDFRTEDRPEEGIEVSFIECWYPRCAVERHELHINHEIEMKALREVIFWHCDAHKFMLRFTVDCPAWKSVWAVFELP